MPVINGVYTKDFPNLGRDLADSDIIVVAIPGNNVTYKTTYGALKTYINLANLVPYTGATTDVDLGTHSLTAESITLDPTPATIPTAQGSLYFDDDELTLAVVLNGTVQKVGEDVFFQIKNQSGSTIPKGTAVRFDGVVGGSGRILAVPFLADGTYPSIYFLGITSEEIANGGDGKAYMTGKIRGINTNAYAVGTILYCSTTVAGGYQTTAPVAPNNIISVAAVINQSATVGEILVRPTLGSNINRDEGVLITSPTTGDLLQLQSDGLWKNKTVASLGLVPTSRTLTINGTAYDLSADRTWSVGTVTSVAALTIGTTGTDITSTVANGTTTPVITLNVPDASATARGVITTGTQTIAGTKTFESSGIVSNFNRTAAGGAIIALQMSGVDKSFIEWNINDAGTNVGTNFSLRNGQGAIALWDNTNSGLKVSAGNVIISNKLSNGTYEYTLPSATGTLALTSALGNYLPLSGGTLTGALSGTSATFSGKIAWGTSTYSAGVSSLWNQADNGTLLLPKAGSVNDFTHLTAGGGILWQNPTGTSNAIFEGSIGAKNTIYSNSGVTESSGFQLNSITMGYSTTGTYGWITAGGAAARTSLVLNANGGNVGIGTTSPGNFSGVTFTAPFLDVAGTIQVKGISANGIAALQFGGDTYRKGIIYTSVGTDTPYMAFGVATSGSSSTTNEVVKIFSNGNTFIGSSPTDAGYKLDVNGTGRFSSSVNDNGTIHAYTSKSANYTLTGNDYYVKVTADATMTLPTAVGRAGQRYVIRAIGSGVDVTMGSTSSQTINGGSAGGFTLNGTNENVIILFSDGANWFTETYISGA